jgi:hypothetical protein
MARHFPSILHDLEIHWQARENANISDVMMNWHLLSIVSSVIVLTSWRPACGVQVVRGIRVSSTVVSIKKSDIN